MTGMQKMMIAYKFRLYSSRKDHRLHNLVTTAARIRNHCVAFQRVYYKLFKKYCHKFALMKHIAKVRNRREAWRCVAAKCLSAIVGGIDLAYQSFFKWTKTRKGPKRGRPGFRRSFGCGSVVFRQNSWSYLGGNKVRFGKYVHKFVKSREIEGRVKICTLKRDSMNRLWVVFSCEKEENEKQVTGSINTAGFDFGLKTFLTCSDGTTIESPQFFKSSLAEVAKRNQELARKRRGSNSRRKAKHRLIRAHERVANRRADWFYKLAHSLCDRFDRMYFETLNIAGMKKLWGRKISDLSFAAFLETLKWVAHKRGKYVGQVSQWAPTSKMCSRCSHAQEILLETRVFTCESCGLSIDRDLNAALNVKLLGHQQDGLGDVRHDFGCAGSV